MRLSSVWMALVVFVGRSFVGAIFADEAFNTDWQVANMGHYDCVLGSHNAQLLYILSKVDGSSLISLVNATTGDIVMREILDINVIDAMVEASGILLKSDTDCVYMFNTTTGILAKGAHDLSSEFISSCSALDLKGISISGQKLKVLDSKSQLEVFHIDLPDNLANIEYLYTDYVGKLDILYSTGLDHYEFQSYKNGQVQNNWKRNESLSEVVAHTIVSLPDLATEKIQYEPSFSKDVSNPLLAYTHRIKNNYLRLVNYWKSNGASPGEMLTNFLFPDSLSEEAQAELEISQSLKFGLLKYLVVATKNDEITALNTKNGGTVWSFISPIPNVITLHFIEAKNELLVFGKSGTYAIFDLKNSLKEPKLIKLEELGHELSNVKILDEDGLFLAYLSNGQKKIVTVGEQEKTVCDDESNIFIADHDKNGVYGHIMVGEGTIKNTWEWQLNSAEKLVAYAGRNKYEATVNPGIVLGNRTVLYKYLYPNLAGFLVINEQTNELTLNIVDTVTGALVYTQYHNDGVSKNFPMDIVFGEHWVIYSYYSSNPVPEQKLVVVELYESLEPDKRVSSSEGFTTALQQTPKSEAISKAYFFPEIIKSLQISKTKFGISTKAILIEMDNGQLTFVPKAILSARRVEESLMSEDDKKEFMATPYISTIPVNDYFVISHTRHILLGKNSRLISADTNLESTSIVCALGHDIFCTRIYPSSQFDLLSKTFERGKLVITILVMLLLGYVLRPMVANKKLKTIWLVRG